MPGMSPGEKGAVLAAGMGVTGRAEGLSLPLDVPSSCSWSHQREGAPSTELPHPGKSMGCQDSPHPRKSMGCQDGAPVSLFSSSGVSVGLQQTRPREGWQRGGATSSTQEPGLQFQKIK